MRRKLHFEAESTRLAMQATRARPERMPDLLMMVGVRLLFSGCNFLTSERNSRQS